MSQDVSLALVLELLRGGPSAEHENAVNLLLQSPLEEIAVVPLDVLLETVEDKDERVRARIAAVLGKAGSAAAAPALVRMLGDKIFVRWAAKESLEEIGWPAGDQLLEALKACSDFRVATIIEIVGNIRYGPAVPVLVDILLNPVGRLRSQAARALGKIGDGSAAAALGLALGRNLVGDEAITALRQIGREAVAQLADALGHRSPGIRRMAAHALRDLPDSRAVPALIRALEDADSWVQIAAAASLAALGLPRGISALIEIARRDSDVSRYALEELGSQTEPSLLPILLDAWNDVHDGIHGAAALALREVADESVLPLFLDALSDERANRRGNAALILGAIGDPAAAPKLTLAAQDNAPDVRINAIGALDLLGEPYAIPVLVDALEDGDSRVKIAAMMALGNTNNAAAIPPLISVLRGPDDELATTAAEALGMLSHASAVPALIAALGSPNSELRSAAATALGEIADLDALPHLERLLSDNSPRNPSANWPLRPAGGKGPVYGDPANETLVSDVASAARARLLTRRALKTVRFTAYYPKEILPDVWYAAHLYVSGANEAEHVAADALSLLGHRVADIRAASTTKHVHLRGRSRVEATPALRGFVFNPPSQSIYFDEPWHRLDFRLKASPKYLDKSSNGTITVTIDGAIAASIPISIYVRSESRGDEITAHTAAAYRSLFCSYSHRDQAVVRRVERACRALGIECLRDEVALKSGARWSEELCSMIDRADIFQLFWSRHAAASQFVEMEWRYALHRDTERFIHPVYWKSPMPHAPAELAHIHFAFTPNL